MTVYVYAGTAGCKPGTGNMGNMENKNMHFQQGQRCQKIIMGVAG